MHAQTQQREKKRREKNENRIITIRIDKRIENVGIPCSKDTEDTHRKKK